MEAGAALDPPQRASLAKHFGFDLSHVRVRTDAPAARAADELNARAFTIGQHLFFGAGQYQPDRPEGLRLLAHEVAHAAQQRYAPVRSQPMPFGEIPRLPPDHAGERAAHAAADAFATGLRAPPLAPASLSVACQEKGEQGKSAPTPLVAGATIDLAAKRVKFETSTGDLSFGKANTDLEAGTYTLVRNFSKKLWGVVGSKPESRRR